MVFINREGIALNHKEDGCYLMDNYLYDNMAVLKEAIRDDFDWVVLIVGDPGVGKSVMAQQIAYYLDPTFNIDRITFDNVQYKKTALKLKPYSAIIYDEAKEGLDSKQALSLISKELTDFFAECRQLNLFHIIVLPNFFELNKSLAMSRSICLLRIRLYIDKQAKKFRRGRWYFYDKERKNKLYLMGKKYEDYSVVQPNVYGSYANTYLVDEAQYRANKLAALRSGKGGLLRPSKRAERWIRQRDILIRRLSSCACQYTQKEIAEWIGIDQSEISNIVNMGMDIKTSPYITNEKAVKIENLGY